jgi:hypothetical protein
MSGNFEQPQPPEKTVDLHCANELVKCAHDTQPNPMEQLRPHIQQAYNGLDNHDQTLLKIWLDKRSGEGDNMWQSNAMKVEHSWVPHSKELEKIEAEVKSPALAKQWLTVINEMEDRHS